MHRRRALVGLILVVTVSLARAQAEADGRAAAESGSGEPQPFSIVDTRGGLSLYDDMFLLPATWSDVYSGDETEVIFQLSAKLRVARTRLFFAYTQISFWQLYNGSDSRPFRETNYNPQLFCRFTPRVEGPGSWVVDVGIDHQSNGQSEPGSRSWNRAYGTLHYATPRHLLSLKLWYRFPEKECPIGEDGLEDEECRDDPSYDDNPRITDFLGYTEVRYRYHWTGGWRPQRFQLRAHGNPATGKGGVGGDYSVAAGSRDLHWFVRVWHGYGESLIDHDRSVTRYGAGLLLLRTAGSEGGE
jgi:phospholipase A1